MSLIIAYPLGEVIKDPLKKKTSDLQTKNWGWSLRSTESISREFLSPGWKTKILDVFENVTFGTDCIKFKIVFFNCLWANFTLLDSRNWGDYTIFCNERHKCKIKAKPIPESQFLSGFCQRHLLPEYSKMQFD